MDAPQPLDGRYRFLRRLRGAPSVIAWIAADTVARRTVVVSTIAAARVPGLEVAIGVGHPHLSTLLDVFDEVPPEQIPDGETLRPGTTLGVAVHVDGITLTDKRDEQVRAPWDAVNLVLKIAGALHALHSNGGVHGAISQRAVVVQRSDGGVVPVLTNLIGAPSAAYCSPTRIKGGGPTQQDDTWALYAILFAALTGKPAFRGASREELAAAVIGGNIPNLAQHGVDDPALQHIIDLGFHPTKASRKTSAEDLELDLTDWLESQSSDDAQARQSMPSLESFASLPMSPATARDLDHYGQDPYDEDNQDQGVDASYAGDARSDDQWSQLQQANPDGHDDDDDDDEMATVRLSTAPQIAEAMAKLGSPIGTDGAAATGPNNQSGHPKSRRPARPSQPAPNNAPTKPGSFATPENSVWSYFPNPKSERPISRNQGTEANPGQPPPQSATQQEVLDEMREEMREDAHLHSAEWSQSKPPPQDLTRHPSLDPQLDQHKKSPRSLPPPGPSTSTDAPTIARDVPDYPLFHEPPPEHQRAHQPPLHTEEHPDKVAHAKAGGQQEQKQQLASTKKAAPKSVDAPQPANRQKPAIQNDQNEPTGPSTAPDSQIAATAAETERTKRKRKSILLAAAILLAACVIGIVVLVAVSPTKKTTAIADQQTSGDVAHTADPANQSDPAPNDSPQNKDTTPAASTVPPTNSDHTDPSEPAAPTLDVRACVESFFPPNTFLPVTPLDAVCSDSTPQKAVITLYKQIVNGGNGKVTEGMRIWSNMSWYEIAIASMVRTKCCPDSQPFQFPEGIEQCDPLSEAISKASTGLCTPEAAKERSSAVEQPVKCLVAHKRILPFRYTGAIKADQRRVFEDYIQQLPKEHCTQ
ncbi:MAG: hypothetical protein FWD57_01570 [Polyangiaceae bacterium]|nr:hypothetical protein [Polyangiaceae bacterium]